MKIYVTKKLIDTKVPVNLLTIKSYQVEELQSLFRKANQICHMIIEMANILSSFIHLI